MLSPSSTRLTLLSLLLIALSSLLTASAASIQSPNAKGNAARANAVKAAFQQSFNAYKQYCFGQDQLQPLTKTCTNPLGGWGASVVDAMDTAKVMGLEDIYNECVAQSLKTDYTKTSQDEISIFETTIRHVGGLLSAYELGGMTEKGLVDQAVVVGDRLLHGWVGNNPAPFNLLRSWSTNPTPVTDQGAIIAETGTLLLEFDRLSKHSGNNTYRDYAVKAMKGTIAQTGKPFPGLNPQGINPATLASTDDYVTWGGGSDSFFEYELKSAQLLGTADTYLPAWITTVNSSIAQLMTTPGGLTLHPNLLYLADYSKSSGGLIPRGSHLECFDGGNWLLGGKLLGNSAIFNYGLRLTDACINTYTSTADGIGPESFVYKTSKGSTNGVTINNKRFYYQHGFDVDAVDYVLRPEVVESVFYAYRMTGQQKYADAAWSAFQSILKHCSTSTALTSLNNVTDPSAPQLNDSESFLYAELFKYLYLTFADPSTLDLTNWVFNTEAHPFQIDVPGVTFPQLNPGGRLAKPGSGSASRTSGSSSSTGTANKVPLPKFSSSPDISSIVNNLVGSVSGVLERRESDQETVLRRRAKSGNKKDHNGALTDARWTLREEA